MEDVKNTAVASAFSHVVGKRGPGRPPQAGTLDALVAVCQALVTLEAETPEIDPDDEDTLPGFSRREVLDESGIDSDYWTRSVRKLLAAQVIEKHGERRNATYTLSVEPAEVEAFAQSVRDLAEGKLTEPAGGEAEEASFNPDDADYKDLRAFAKENEIPGYHQMKKEDLREACRALV